MTASTGQRSYRACIRCRQRKQRCELSSAETDGQPPCRRCQREGHHCVLAGSRRGGDRTHRRAQPSTTRAQDPIILACAPSTSPRAQSSGASFTPTGFGQDQVETAASAGSSDISKQRHRVDGKNFQGNLKLRSASTICLPSPPQEGLQNPREALEILVRTATESSPSVAHNNATHQATNTTKRPSETAASGLSEAAKTLSDFEPVASGDVDAHSLAPLVRFYMDNYHQFMPIVPRRMLSTEKIADLAVEEPFLLTAILTVATRDREDVEALHSRLWKHMRHLILSVSIGDASVRSVGAVEGLLLLAEWVQSANSHRLRSTRTRLPSSPSFDNEDSTAWSLIGLAVRQSYLLRLDRYSFRNSEVMEATGDHDRGRLAWVWVYLSDRQISIRMGQAFWCRGPGLAARFTANDYVSLQPSSECDDNFAHFLQSQVEITTVFGNIHDILYASKTRTAGLMLAGDYTKYLDDGAKAVAAWQEIWRDIRVLKKLRTVLRMLHDYLSLYIHAFALQAVVYRASSSTPPDLSQTSVSRTLFPHGVMASPDGQHIHVALNAAKSLLRTAVDDLDPETELRFLPVRFYLYEVHAVVFLFKAFSYGAVTQREHDETSKLVWAFVERLRRATSGYAHIANRYAVLLSHLLNSASLRNHRPSIQDAAGGPAMSSVSARRDGLEASAQCTSLDTGVVHPYPLDAQNPTAANTNDVFALWPDFSGDGDLFLMDGSLDSLPFPGPNLEELTGD